MFYHNVISYNDYESVLALIENRNSVIMCFSAPPILTKETVEINLKRITELEQENEELKKQLEMSNKVYNDNLDYSHHIEEQLTKAKEIISEYINILKGDTKNWKKTQEKAILFHVEQVSMIL
jgi:hypothetical protein